MNQFYYLGAMTMERVILVEFNELTPHLLERWMASGDLPNFKRLHDSSVVYITRSDALEPANMEPWIQWYSIHTGLPFSEHKVFHLTDGPRSDALDIWHHLHAHGKRVWNCSSMNARGFSFENSCYLPDPWCTTEVAFPPALNKFHKFVSHQVREYSKKEKLSLQDALSFLTYMAGHGLSFDTSRLIVKQLISEKTLGGHLSWRRVAIQDRLLADVFEHHFKRFRPDFSSFFANSTAHLQHSYWRHMEPDAFTVKPSSEELERYGDAIRFGYRMMDQVLGRILKLAGGSARVILATALSQQPYLKYEHVGGHRFYRPRKVEDLLRLLEIDFESVQPVMTHQFLVRLPREVPVFEVRQKIEALRLQDRTIFGFDEADSSSVYFGCQIRDTVDMEALVTSSFDVAIEVPFGSLFYQVEGMKSGRHHPDGCLWIQSSEPKVMCDTVSILDIFPTVCGMLDVPHSHVAGRVLVH